MTRALVIEPPRKVETRGSARQGRAQLGHEEKPSRIDDEGGLEFHIEGVENRDSGPDGSTTDR